MERKNFRENNPPPLVKIIDKYIAKKFLSTLGFILVLAVFLIIIFDLTEKLDDLLAPAVTFKEIVFDYYLNYIPIIINLISPLVIFITVIFFTARMANDTEVVAILSSGVSYWRFILPFFGVALLLAFGDFIIKNHIIPKAYETENIFEMKYIEKGYNFQGRNIHKQLDDNTYFYTQSFDYQSGIAYRFSIEKFKKKALVYKLQCNEAQYDTTKKIWKLRNYTARNFNGLKEEIKKGDSMTMKLPIGKKDFAQKLRTVTSMTTPELSAFIEAESFKGDSQVNFYKIEKSKRLALPFAIIILVMMAVSIASRKIRGGVGMHIMIGILIAVSYELSMRFSTTFSTNADMPPNLAVWLPNIVFGMVALFLLNRAQK
ncbi:MAG: LptF/LptG family permease [Bacteroidetes bacterium]|nr:LptF/LptG family permease [Bacteroidota bacterium]